eukprot:8529798-Pyramimonas_sp.AAC.1
MRKLQDKQERGIKEKAALGLELGAHPAQRMALGDAVRPALREEDDIDETTRPLEGGLVSVRRVGRQEVLLGQKVARCFASTLSASPPCAHSTNRAALVVLPVAVDLAAAQA